MQRRARALLGLEPLEHGAPSAGEVDQSVGTMKSAFASTEPKTDNNRLVRDVERPRATRNLRWTAVEKYEKAAELSNRPLLLYPCRGSLSQRSPAGIV